MPYTIYREISKAFLMGTKTVNRFNALLYSMKINGQIKTYTPDSLNANIIKKVLTFINEHYFEEITIDELAAVSGFSKSHFTANLKNKQA